MDLRVIARKESLQTPQDFKTGASPLKYHIQNTRSDFFFKNPGLLTFKTSILSLTKVKKKRGPQFANQCSE